MPAVVVVIVAGIQVPEMPFNEVAGRAGGVEFWHSGPIGSNVGVISGVIVTDTVAGIPH